MQIYCTEPSEKGKVHFNCLRAAQWRYKLLLLPKKMEMPWKELWRILCLNVMSLLLSSSHFHSYTQWKRNLTDTSMDSQNPKPVLFCRLSKIVIKYLWNHPGKAKTYRGRHWCLHCYGSFVEHPCLVHIPTSRSYSGQSSLAFVHS